MDTAKSRSLCLAILLGALLIIPTPQAWAQANELPEGWEIQVIPMWMWVGGFDEHVGDVVEGTFTNPDGTELIAFNHKPINLEMDSNVTGRVELTFRRDQWGFGVSGWFFLTDEDESGGVTTPSPAAIPGFLNSVSMWDAIFLPLADDFTSSGAAPFSFFADAELNTFTFDIFGLRTLAEKPASRIDLLAGLKLGWLDMEVNQGLATRGFFGDPPPGDLFYEFLSANSAADSDFLGIGPMVGFAGDATWERFRVKAFITQSVLAGEADLDGVWKGNVEGGEADSFGGPFTPAGRLRGDVRFSKEETVFIPVTEAQIKVKYEITENIAIGLAGFASIWIDAPAPPTYHAPLATIAFDDPDGAIFFASQGTWELEERTLSFLGVGIDIEIMWL